MFALILACAGPAADPVSAAPPPAPDADVSPPDPPTPPPDADTPPATEPTMPVLLLCGGGTEGDVGDLTSWSAVYADLLRNGDVTGDALVRVAVISDGAETDWVPTYFESLGADEAFNLLVDTRAAADAVVLDDVDAVFLKGGDQGAYYDLWNDTALETAIQNLYRQTLGGVGGTSAGAMSISALALAGGMDLVSADVLEDSHTPYLRDDSDGGSGVHDDFFALLEAETLVDTHFSNRGRLARLAGTLAEAIDVYGLASPLGIGIDEQTCATVQGGVATVSGVGAVTFLRPGSEAAVRVPGDPLIWAGLHLDRLIAGGTYDLLRDTADLGGESVTWDGVIPAASSGDWSADGARPGDEDGFERVIERPAYGTRPGDDVPLLLGATGILDAHDPDLRGLNDAALFRALYDHLGLTGFFVGDGGRLVRRDGDGGLVELGGQGTPQSTMVLDATGVTTRALAPGPGPWDPSLHAVGLTGVALHVLFTDGDGRVWDLDTRRVLTR